LEGQLSLWNREIKSDEDKIFTAWEFCKDSLEFIEGSKYKTVSKYLIEKWKKTTSNHCIRDILFEFVDLKSKGRAIWILVRFDWEGPGDLSIWLEDKTRRKEDLIDYLKETESKLLRYIQK